MLRSSEERWYFTRKQLSNTPSIRVGKFTAEKELSFRQQAANLIQDMGQRLKVTQLCINTAIVYMHRFYMFHSFTHFNRSSLSVAALFLAAKVEEQPRKIEYMINMSHKCLHPNREHDIVADSEHYQELLQDLLLNENVLLKTLGFDLAIIHPHTYVVHGCTMAQATKDVAQTAYFLASRSLRLTTMCLQYRPTLVACFCINLAIKRSGCEIKVPVGDTWFHHIDPSVTQETLDRLTEENLDVFYKSTSMPKQEMTGQGENPMLSQTKNRIMSIKIVDLIYFKDGDQGHNDNPLSSKNEDLMFSQNKDPMSNKNENPMTNQNQYPKYNQDKKPVSVKNGDPRPGNNGDPRPSQNKDPKSRQNGDPTQEHTYRPPSSKGIEKKPKNKLEAQASRAA